MSVPASAYYRNATFGLWAKINVGGTVTKAPHLLVLFTTAYPTETEIKRLFYLDYVKADIKEQVGGTTMIGYVCGVIEGSANAAMHNLSTRFSGLRNKVGSNKILILNDGGLNTKGMAEWVDNVSVVFTNIVVEVEFRPAFYVPSTKYGVIYRYKLADGSGWAAWAEIDIQPTYGAISGDIAPTRQIPIPSSGTPYRSVQVIGFQTNAEGDFEEPFGVEITPELVSVLLENNTVWTNSPTTYYIDDTSIITKENGGQVQLYTNANQTGKITTAIAKLWEDSRYYYTFGYDTESDKYIILTRVDSTPPTPTSWAYQGYSASSQVDADNQVIMGTGTSGTIYYNEDDNTWHVSWSAGVFGALAADGYYAQGDLSGVVDQKELINGIQQ